ncbi:enoyl-CoA hydratase/isomerase family protein [Halogeometricum sp. S1BR25-6]|uniref:Enoyl-CoA hydratase/isomerase family protein n=1 Tax=Halogeometricum salsisoli TaxID=2950536 RepID=A0ABU2GGJ5_9EURY|nr:enoyl-CoA hydratase/isomerase family protein [Halogeometricum sp. S1BR25-6]MDS0299941.1 enoyl-CoA hydratase/isomerase family protein [Halogeometricum sp. S1BR25-6]
MIRTTADGAVRVVTLDRPDRRNALRPADLDELAAAVAGADPETTPVVYLRGAGGHFSAGADLDSVAALDDPEAFARRGQRVANAIADAPVTVVAGIDGAARGGGVELALACDVRVATPHATFAEPGVRFGLFGAWGGTVRLPRIVGEGEALDFALSGRVVDAAEARRMGLVSRVVDDPRSVADEIAANRPDALRAVKARLRDDADDETRERAEAEAFARLHGRYADEIREVRDGRGG